MRENSWVSDGSAYQPTASSTFKNHTVTPEAWSIGYLGASVSGYRANDTVHLGVVEVPNTIVEVATNVGAGLPAGGIVGLNLPGPGYKSRLLSVRHRQQQPPKIQ